MNAIVGVGCLTKRADGVVAAEQVLRSVRSAFSASYVIASEVIRLERMAGGKRRLAHMS